MLKKLIAGPTVFIYDECVDLCIGIVEPDDDIELLQLTKEGEERGEGVYAAWLDLARRTSTARLAHCGDGEASAQASGASGARSFVLNYRGRERRITMAVTRTGRLSRRETKLRA